jgi:succinate dehydrogenase / fumarate reductase cytochrome b subunit
MHRRGASNQRPVRVNEEASIVVNKTRPVNLDLGTIALPVTAKASILHRISGVFLVVAVGVLLYLLDLSLDSAQGFAQATEILGSLHAKIILWAVLSGLIYHSVAGVKHLLMDLGIGETLAGGLMAARLVFAVSGVLIVAAGVWLW